MRWPSLGALMACMVAACDGPVTAPSADAGPATADIGVGDDDWQPLVDDQVVRLVLGVQGGQHIIGHARMENLWPGEEEDMTDAPRIAFQVVDQAGTEWSAAMPAMRQRFFPSAAGGYELPAGWYVFMKDGAEALDGQQVFMTVRIQDMTGDNCADTRRVILDVVSER
jgi:hypothetical protein